MSKTSRCVWLVVRREGAAARSCDESSRSRSKARSFWQLLRRHPPASGYLGYAYIPNGGGVVCQDFDGCVINWTAFGRNSAGGPPYNQGRTATHEVGHYLGLFHTFDGGCGNNNCYNSGDLICDTNKESGPVFGCPGNSNSCSSPDPFHNYMDYSNDTCMWEFTADQANRMRCTLVNWRPDLGETCGVMASALGRTGTNPNIFFANPPVLGGAVTFNVIDSNYNFATLLAEFAQE